MSTSELRQLCQEALWETTRWPEWLRQAHGIREANGFSERETVLLALLAMTRRPNATEVDPADPVEHGRMLRALRGPARLVGRVILGRTRHPTRWLREQARQFTDWADSLQAEKSFVALRRTTGSSVSNWRRR